jgi:hypothetical protein
MIDEDHASLTAKIPKTISQALKKYTVDTKGSLRKQHEVVEEALEIFLKEKGYLTNAVPA